MGVQLAELCSSTDGLFGAEERCLHGMVSDEFGLLPAVQWVSQWQESRNVMT
jgi:hypothetical protein